MPSVGSCNSVLYDTVLAEVAGDAVAAAAVCQFADLSLVDPAVAVTRWTLAELRLAQSLAASAQQGLAELQDRVAQVGYGLNVAFVLMSAYQVFVMQLGFALFAAGVVRPKSIVALLLKNFFDTCIAGVMFYLVGYAFAFGAKDGSSNGFIGNWNFALSATDGSPGESGPQPWHLFVWNWSFCSAATTILSGSIAERATFVSYTIYSVIMPSWVYPVVAHWLWSPDGWLSARNMSGRILGVGAIDFAGSGVVHLVGGMAALIGSMMTGPRVGRFSGAGFSTQTYRATAAPQLYLMGTFLLWFGWYGFNPGSALEIDSYVTSSVVGRTAVTTTLSACVGSLAGLVIGFWRHRVWDLLATCMGALAGLVSVTAGCAVLEPWAAIICGLVGACVCDCGDRLLEWAKIDDPVSAFSVHGLCGAWGLLYVGLMGQENYIYQTYDVAPGHNRMGLFYGGHGQLLLCQVIAIAVISGWTATNMGPLFWALRQAGILRVTADKEAAGMDLAACGQLNSPGAVNIHSSKVQTKGGDMLLAAVSMDRRLNGGPGLDLSVRNPAYASNNPSNHATVRPEPGLQPAPAALPGASGPLVAPSANGGLDPGPVLPHVSVHENGGIPASAGPLGGSGGARDGSPRVGGST